MSEKWKGFKAIYGDGNPITTVLAKDEDDARERVEYQLQKNPSRIWYYQKWVNDGRKLKNMETGEITQEEKE